MRKIVVTEFVSLDGVMEDPGWTFPYWNDEIAKFKGEETSSSDALLLGRVTYEAFATAWPNSKDEGAPYFNNVRKYVVSTTLNEPLGWNNSMLIKDSIMEEIARLKQQPGQTITVHGSGTLARSLIENNLVDQINLLIYPLVLGKGRRLFEGIEAKLKLADCRTFSGGVTALIYQPAGDGAA